MGTEINGIGQDDLLDATTITSYKCANCGNMFPVDQSVCEVCGYHCSQDACQIIKASDQGY